MQSYKITYAAEHELSDPVEDAQIDIRILACGLLLALLCCLLSQVLVEATAGPAMQADTEVRRRSVSMQFSLPLPIGSNEWLDYSHGNPLVVASVELFILINGEKLLANPKLITRDSQLRQEWKLGDFQYGLYSRAEKIGSIQQRNSSGSFDTLPVELLQIELTCEFNDTVESYPIDVTSYLRVTTPKPPPQVAQELLDIWKLIARAADEGVEPIFDWPLVFQSSTGMMVTTLEPEGINQKQLIPMLVYHQWASGTRIFYGINAMPPQTMEKLQLLAGQVAPTLSSAIDWSSPAGVFSVVSAGQVGDVPSFTFDLRSDIRLDLSDGDDELFLTPKITQSIRPTLELPTSFKP